MQLGQIVCTAGVNDLMRKDLDFAIHCKNSLARYDNKDWGDIGDDDKQVNTDALLHGNRLFAAYKGPEKIYIITEWDRSVTTILLPSEY